LSLLRMNRNKFQCTNRYLSFSIVYSITCSVSNWVVYRWYYSAPRTKFSMYIVFQVVNLNWDINYFVGQLALIRCQVVVIHAASCSPLANVLVTVWKWVWSAMSVNVTWLLFPLKQSHMGEKPFDWKIVQRIVHIHVHFCFGYDLLKLNIAVFMNLLVKNNNATRLRCQITRFCSRAFKDTYIH